MGGHHSHEAKADGGSGSNTPRGSQRGSGSRSGSGGDLQGLPDKQDKPPPSMVPIEKLGKLLVQKSQKEDGVNGVTENSFTKYLFPMYPELARQFFQLVRRRSRATSRHVPLAAFRAQCEKILAMLDDDLIIETYVKMFSDDEEENTVTAECVRRLLYTSYKISMDHHPDGPQTCLMINRTLSSVINGCFNNKDSHSVGFVVRWLSEHCHRIIFPLHRYSVHSLATRHRSVEEGPRAELSPPVLAPAPPGLLPPSAAWLLAAAAPPLYSRPTDGPPAASARDPAAAWLARLVCALPSHWTPLYCSSRHGLATNRFLHHTLAYRGPTLVLLQAQELVLALCCPSEWRESQQYWGGPDCALIQMQPTLCVVERGPRLLYLNTALRGYPRGLRAGRQLQLAADFDRLHYRAAAYRLDAIEVWGCGDSASREAQLEIKKWQIKEAERQRCVKLSAAEWMEHPDRYLLELAGRPQYRSSAS